MTNMVTKQKTRNVLGALPLLAQARGRQYGVKVFMGGRNAATDGKNIFLPSMPIDDPDTIDLALGYLSHECGHIAETDNGLIKETKLKDFFKGHLLNLFEDIREEAIMSKRYPGIRGELARLVKKLVKIGKFGMPDPNDAANVVCLYMLYTLRFQILGQTGVENMAEQCAKQIDESYPGLRAELDAFMFEVQVAESTDDCLDLAEKAVKAIRKFIEEPPQDEGDEGEESQECDSTSDASGGSGSGQSDADNSGDQDSNGSGSSSGDDEEASEDDSDSSDGNSDKDSGSEEDSQGDDGSSSGDGTDEDTQGNEDASSESGDTSNDSGGNGAGKWTEEMVDQLKQALESGEEDVEKLIGEVLKELMQEAHDQIGGWNDDGFGVAKEVGYSPKKLNVNKVKRETNALRTRLNSLLQAKQETKNMPRRVGRRLDARRFVRLQAGDQRVFKGRNYKRGVNTAVHLVLDRSGSMDGAEMNLANDCMLAVKLALENNAMVNLGISAFPASGGYIQLVKHGQKRDNRIGLEADGGTPLGDTLWAVGGQMQHLKEARKVIIVITDGAPDSIEGAKTAINGLEKSGFEVLGLGIMTNAVKPLFRHSSVLNKLSELPNALFGMLQELLV